MADLARRSIVTELMDTERVTFEEFRECLQHLEMVNRWTFAYRPTLTWLDRLVRQNGQPQYPLSILDVGFGHGDMLRRIAHWAERRGMTMQLRGIDLSPWSARAASDATPGHMPIRYETGDVFSYADEQPPADLVISSLFTHHLTDDELIRFLYWMTARARIGWFINDLHRHPVPYHVIRSVLRLLPVNRMVRHDAPVSVARAFTRQDWVRLLRGAGLSAGHARIEWFFPFRYGVGYLR